MQKNIRKAFEDHLMTVPNGLGEDATAFENAPFDASTTNTYQLSRLVPFPVENPTYGDDYHREVGFYQVTVSVPKGTGVGRLADYAEDIKRHFKRGTTLYEQTDRIIVERTPEITSVYINDNRAEVTVRIRYFSEQYN